MEKLTITPAIWRLKAYQKKTQGWPGRHGIAWNEGHAYATDGASLVAIKDTQEVPGTWRVLLDGKAPLENIEVPLALGTTAIKHPRGGYSVVEIFDSQTPPVPWQKVCPAKKDAYRELTLGVLGTMLEATGKKSNERQTVRLFEPDGPLAPMRLSLPDDVIAIIMPVRMD